MGALCVSGLGETMIVLVSPFATSLLRGQKWDPRHLCIESSLIASIRVYTLASWTNSVLCLTFSHFSISKINSQLMGWKKDQAKDSSSSTLSTNSLPKIKYPFGVRRTSLAPLQLLGRNCFPAPASPPQAFLTLNVPQPLQGEGKEYEGEIGVVSKCLLFPEPWLWPSIAQPDIGLSLPDCTMDQLRQAPPRPQIVSAISKATSSKVECLALGWN